tara:strand:- start:135 stop:581 length:447 start_codon:yes stop_codon:yes gene_type:complete
MIKQISIKTKFGWITALEKQDKIFRIKFGKSNKNSNSKNLRKLKLNINNFFAKKTKKIRLKIKMNGTEVQKKIWRELLKIKFGKTKSYSQIGKKLGIHARQVGKICGENKILLAIPCHRVIRSDGSLGGFSGLGGLSLKKKLLNFEKN